MSSTVDTIDTSKADNSRIHIVSADNTKQYISTLTTGGTAKQIHTDSINVR